MTKKIFLLLVFFASIYISINTNFLKKQKLAGLQIECPGSASVFINNQYLGQAPLLEENLQSGEVIIKIVPDKEKLASFTIPLSLEKKALTVIIYNPGENLKDSSNIIFELKSLKNKKTALSFESYPENALVSLDGNPAQKTPFRVEDLKEGDHHFVLSLTEYQEQEYDFQILEGYETRITTNLAKNNNEKEKVSKEPELSEKILESSDSSQIVGTKVKIKETNYFFNEVEGLKVRNASNSSAIEIGFAKTKFFYPYLEEKSADQSWLKINFKGDDAWISAQYAEIIESLDL